MKKLSIWALAAALCGSVGATINTTFDPCASYKWFTAAMPAAGATSSTALPAGWVAGSADTVLECDGAAISFEADDLAGAVSNSTVVVATNGFVRQELAIVPVACETLPSTDDLGANVQTAFTVLKTTSGDASALAYYAYVKTNDTASGWIALSGTPSESDTKTVAIEFCYTGAVGKVSFVTVDGTTDTRLAATLDGAEKSWFDVASSGVASGKLTSTAFVGTGKISAFTGYQAAPLAADATPVKEDESDSSKFVVTPTISSGESSTTVSISLPKSYTPAGKTTAIDYSSNPAALSSTGKNDMPVWESVVLGLDPEDATSKPKIASATQASGSGVVTLTLGNVTPSGGTGATVTYTIETASAPDFSSGKGADIAVGSDGTATLTAPSASVQYYRVKATITK